MRKVSVLVACGLVLCASASAATYVIPGYGNFNIGSSGENSLLNIYNTIAGTSFANDAAGWQSLFNLAVDPNDYANGLYASTPTYGTGGPQLFFNGDVPVVFEARYAGAQHRLYVTDNDSGAPVQLTLLPLSGQLNPAAPGIPLGTVTPGTGSFASITNPWDLRLENVTSNHSVSTDRYVNLNNSHNGNPATTPRDGIYALIFRIASQPNTYVIAFEDLLSGDFDFNDVVLTAVTVVPLPSALGLLLLGMGGVGALRMRRKAAKS